MNTEDVNKYFLNLFNSQHSLDYINDFYQSYKNIIDIETSNIAGETPFLLASKNNNKNALTWLLDKGANVKIKSKNIGFNALMLAILVDSQDSIDWLIENSIGIEDRTQRQESCLDIAISEGSTLSVQKLIKAGLELDLNNKTYFKKAIDNYFLTKSIDMIKLLIEKNINVDMNYIKLNLLDELYEELVEYKQIMTENKLLNQSLEPKETIKNKVKTKI